MADIDYHNASDFIARQQMSPAQPAEGDGEIGPCVTVYDSRLEVHAGRAVDCDDGKLEIQQAGEQRLDGRSGCAACAGTEERVNQKTDRGPGSVRSHFPDPGCSSEASDLLAQRGTDPGGGHPDGNVRLVQRPRQDPPVTPVVPGPARNQHSVSEHVGVPLGQDVCHGPASAFHERGELETSRNPWFNVSSGDGFYHYHRSWNDDLSLPFAALPG